MRRKEEQTRRGIPDWLVHFHTTPSILLRTDALNPTRNLGSITRNTGIIGNLRIAISPKRFELERSYSGCGRFSIRATS